MGDWYWNNRRGGGGAPVRDSVGNAVPNIKVALRGGHPSSQVSPAHGQTGGYDTRLAQESPAPQRHDQSFREHPSSNVHMASLALMNGADLQERHEKRLRQQIYQQELQQQIEEKNRRKAHEKAERERLQYQDMLRLERQLAQDKAREQQQQQSMSRTDTCVLNNTNHSNTHNQTTESALRNTSVQPTRTLVRASSESNIPQTHRQALDNGAQYPSHAADDVPPRAPKLELRNGRLDADMLDFVRSAAVRTSEGMVMISADLFEKLLGRCEDLLSSHAQLEQQCQELQREQSRQPARRGYDGDSDGDVGVRDDESVVNSVTEERERLAYQKALARTRAKQETRPTRSQSQNSARPTQQAATHGNAKQASTSAPGAKRGASQPPPGRKSNLPNGRSAASANDTKAQRTGATGPRKLSSTATGAGASRRQTGAKEAVNKRARRPGRQLSSAAATKEAPPKLDLNDNQPSSKAPRSRVGTPGTELQAESSLLYLPPDNDADYIGEDQLDVLLRNARATRHSSREADLDYRGMS